MMTEMKGYHEVGRLFFVRKGVGRIIDTLCQMTVWTSLPASQPDSFDMAERRHRAEKGSAHRTAKLPDLQLNPARGYPARAAI